MARHATRNAFTGHCENPFLVLELRPDARRDEVERQGARLLALLAADLAEARAYSTPWGPRARTPEHVRQALADLRDPGTRLVHEWWARGFADAPDA